MTVFIIIAIFLFTVYGILIMTYRRAWKSVPVFTATGEPSTSVSIIIPMRNEEKNIGVLLDAIDRQHYPRHLLEVIVVDDQSEDCSAEIAASYPFVRLLHLPALQLNSYKKKTVETGVLAASGELIICTDADCLPSPEWLRTMVRFYETTQPVFIAAPVRFKPVTGALGTFQLMDFMVLQGITAASVHRNLHAMCNGANLAYRREVFHEVNGFEGIDKLASGDDMMLLYKIRKRYPGRIGYLLAEAAIMDTLPQPTLKSFINQRIRWASKATGYEEKNLLPVLALVYFFNLLFPVLLAAGFVNQQCWWLLAALWAGKTLVELPFYWSVAGFYRIRYTTALLFFFQPFHILYTIVSGLLGQVRSYDWKGRKVS
ncbi:MAG: glycosyltransferase [Chitinophagaceae bacterium]|nr:MAG: glycosyltransferase [Chitinophagaceae bacterium]